MMVSMLILKRWNERVESGKLKTESWFKPNLVSGEDESLGRLRRGIPTWSS